MKLNIIHIPTIAETKITIECRYISKRIQRIIATIRNIETHLPCYQEKTFFQIPVDSILYIDTVDNQTFLYTNSDTYYSKQKLYELENQLAEMEFIRISKNTIVNLHQIEQVKSFGISKLELILTNKEKLIVNRNYLYAFKQKFMA